MTFIKTAVVALSKEIIWNAFNRHSSGARKDIWLAGSRRSGTTLAMQILGANRGLKTLNQPLGLYSAPFWLTRHVPVMESSRYILLDDEEAEQIQRYVTAIREGRMHINEPWDFWRGTFSFRSNRLVFKEVAGLAITPWAEDALGCSVIYLVRHPLAQARSVLRNGWAPTAKAFLRNTNLISKYMDSALHAKAWDAYNSGTPLERHVLSWVLENLIPLRELEKRPSWYFITYESCVLHREEVISEWSRIFDLPDIDRMNKTAAQASRSVRTLSEQSTKRSIRQGRRDALVSGWRGNIPEDVERKAMSILDMFEIDIYRGGDWSPKIMRRLPLIPIGTAPKDEARN